MRLARRAEGRSHRQQTGAAGSDLNRFGAVHDASSAQAILAVDSASVQPTLVQTLVKDTSAATSLAHEAATSPRTMQPDWPRTCPAPRSTRLAGHGGDV